MPDVKVGWRSGTVPSLLDTYTGAAAAYSLRKLRNAYSGFAIRVRRSSDNTEQNIGFTATGGLDTTTLLSFVGAGNGFVTTWYDQSGNGKNAVQINATNQPWAVYNGVLQTYNGKPTIFFNSGYSHYFDCGYLNGGTKPANYSTFALARYTLSSYQVSSIIQSQNNAGQGVTGYNMITMWNNGKMVGNSGDGTNYRYWNGQTSITLNTQRYLFEGHYKSNTSPYLGQIWLNGTSQTISDWLGGIAQQNGGTEFKTSIGRGGEHNGSYFQGDLQEIVMYFTDKTSNRTGISTDINSYYSIWDNDAEAFITAANVSGQASSIRTLVATLKAAGIWSKLKAIYPFVGGTANSHKYNLKDPRDLDEAYRLNFYGGWTHYVSGPYGNGSNSYADTNLNPFLKLNTNSSSIGVWVPNGLANHGFGVWSNSGANRFAITEYGGGFVDSQMTSPTTRAWGITYTTSGFIMGSRTSATSNKIYRFGSQIAVHPSYGGVPHNTTTNTSDYPNANFWLGRVNGNTSISYYNNSLYFAYIADGLTDAEILTLSNAAYTFRQSIGHY